MNLSSWRRPVPATLCLPSTWAPTGVVRVTRPLPTFTVSTEPMAAAEPNLRTSPTSPSGNRAKLAIRTYLQSTGALIFKVLPDTAAAFPLLFSVMLLKEPTTLPAVKTTTATTRTVETQRTLVTTLFRFTNPQMAQIWISRSRQPTPVPARKRCTSMQR